MSIVAWDGKTLSADSRSVIHTPLDNPLSNVKNIKVTTLDKEKKKKVVELPKLPGIEMELSKLGVRKSSRGMLAWADHDHVRYVDGTKKIISIKKNIVVQYAMGLTKIKAVGICGDTEGITNYFKTIKNNTVVDFVQLETDFKDSFSLILIGEDVNFIYESGIRQLEVYDKSAPLQIGFSVLKEFLFLKEYRNIFTSQEIVALSNVYYRCCDGKTWTWDESTGKCYWNKSKPDSYELVNRMYSALDLWLLLKVKNRTKGK